MNKLCNHWSVVQVAKKLRARAYDWSKNSAWCVNIENEFFFDQSHGPTFSLHSQFFHLLDRNKLNLGRASFFTIRGLVYKT